MSLYDLDDNNLEDGTWYYKIVKCEIHDLEEIPSHNGKPA